MDKKNEQKKSKRQDIFTREPNLWECTNKKERANFADELYESDYDKEWN